jgi:hypothetical protein
MVISIESTITISLVSVSCPQGGLTACRPLSASDIASLVVFYRVKNLLPDIATLLVLLDSHDEQALAVT